jgi:hypothetical protein
VSGLRLPFGIFGIEPCDFHAGEVLGKEPILCEFYRSRTLRVIVFRCFRHPVNRPESLAGIDAAFRLESAVRIRTRLRWDSHPLIHPWHRLAFPRLAVTIGVLRPRELFECSE